MKLKNAVDIRKRIGLLVMYTIGTGSRQRIVEKFQLEAQIYAPIRSKGHGTLMTKNFTLQ